MLNFYKIWEFAYKWKRWCEVIEVNGCVHERLMDGFYEYNMTPGTSGKVLPDRPGPRASRKNLHSAG